MKRILIFVLALTLLAIPVAADVPNSINIQGVLMDDTGTPLPDGDYYVVFELWNHLTAGERVWYEETLAHQVGKVFNATLGPGEEFYRDTFSYPLYLRMIIDGDDPTDPRIPLTSVATALRAWSVDPGAAVRSLNGMTNSVTLVAGANVTITQQDTTLVIAATAGAGGADEDWDIDGNDIYHPQGRVNVGLYAPGKGENNIPPARGREEGKASYMDSKLALLGYNQGIYSIMMEGDDLADDRHAIFAQRQRVMDYPNHGTGFGVYETNTAITGYNDWGDSYTFGVAGYSWFDYPNSGGVLGSYHNGAVWGSLAFRDNNSELWGVYSPNNIHSSGLTETSTLRVNNGATAGYIMTSDASGNATWQAPSASQSDGDWTISGQDLFHSGSGTVAIGTGTPTPIYQDQDYTTMQVSGYLLSALCLDQASSGSRWAMYNGGDYMTIGHSNSPSSYPSQVMKVTEEGAELFGPDSGDLQIHLRSYGGMSDGGSIDLYGPTTSDATLRISGAAGYGGGNMQVYNGNDQLEVTITGNFDNTDIGRIITPVLEITGGSDLSEQFDIGNTSLLPEPGMVVSIDPDHPGQLTLCEGAYDRRVAGVISGAGGVNTGMLMGQSGSEADGEHPVALIGRVYVWADATNGPIEPGDLLTSSDLPGHAMKVSDHGRAMGAILGKAMTGLSEGQGLILTLVSLQ
jgi:hypothetical protein